MLHIPIDYGSRCQRNTLMSFHICKPLRRSESHRFASETRRNVQLSTSLMGYKHSHSPVHSLGKIGTPDIRQSSGGVAAASRRTCASLLTLIPSNNYFKFVTMSGVIIYSRLTV